MKDGLIDVERFVALRAMAELTQRALAHDAGVSTSLIKKVEAGQRQLRPPTAWKIARAMGCHPNDFVTRRGVSRVAA